MTLAAPTDAPSRPFFADLCAGDSDQPAVLTADETLTYAQLDQRVAEVADRFGATRRLVVLAADNTIDAVTAYLAALRGRHPLIVAPARDRAALDALIAVYDPDLVAHGADLVERRTGSAHNLHPDLALLLSTSGSTGTPKLVRLSRDNLAANAAAIADYLSLNPPDRAITTLPMQYCYGLSVINSHLHAGAALVLTTQSVVDACFWDLFHQAGATSIAGVPHTFELLDRVGFDSLEAPTLRQMTQAGGRLPPETVRRYARLGERRGWELFVMYGQTEATARMAYLPPALATTHPAAIGIAVPGGQLTIDDPDADGIGELIYHGPNVMLGYAEGSADLALGRTVDELRTGDLARQSDGLFEIVGRRSRFIKPFGLRTDLDHLERLLAGHGTAAMCTGDDHQLVIAVDTTADVAQVQGVVAGRLGLPPSRVHVLQLAELPRLASGKPDYQTIQQLSRADTSGSSTSGAVGDARAEILAAFAEIFDAEPTGDDTFVSLGGDSLSYVEMSVRLEEILGDLPRDWHTTPIRHLAPRERRRRAIATADTSVVLRAVAIVLIVGTHTKLWHHPGGAHVLLAIAGYNFARFQLGATTMHASIARVTIPSMCWIGLVATLSDGFGWPHALLVNGFVGGPDARWAYWFIEALVYILVPLALLFAVPAVARAEHRRPYLVAMAAVALGLVVRFDLVELSTTHRISRPHEVFWLFALGWAAARSTTWRHRLAVTATTLVGTAGFFGDPHRELIVAAGVALVLWLPTLPVPRSAIRGITPIAAASLYIYLTHFQVYPAVNRQLGPAIALVASLLVGVAVWILVQPLTTAVGRRRSQPARATTGAPRRVRSSEPSRSPASAPTRS